MRVDFDGRVVLVTGGTRGIGLATGLAFGRAGARVVLTHRWASEDPRAVERSFVEAGAPEPLIAEADASRPDETRRLLRRIHEEHDGVDVLVSNVCVVPRGRGVQEYRERDLLRSIDYSAWPFVEQLQALKEEFGRHPRYALALSSDGPDRHYPGYDYVAVAKSVLETMARYLATHLRAEQVRVNVLRTRQVTTQSYEELFGEELAQLARSFSEYEVRAEEVAETALALCSGMLDAMSGQVVLADRGASFADNMMTLGPRLWATGEGGEAHATT